MKRILLFIDSLGSGGAQRQLVGLACLLKKRGYDVEVLCYFDRPFYNHILDEHGVRHRVVAGADNHARRIPLLRRAFRDAEPDAVVAFLETPSIIACMLKMMGAKWKLITSERNTTQKNNRKERLRFNMFRVADYVVPNSFSQERFIVRHYPFLKEKVKTIVNFVDLEHFTPPAHKRQREGRTEFVVAASIWASKNTLGFIDALALLKQMNDRFHVRWYGKMPAHAQYIAECEEKIKAYGLEEHIELLDKTKDIVTKYREADVFCLPSFFEGTPNVICEAMACGLPVVCSDVCDNSIYVKSGINGWFFNPTLPQDIADKLYKAIVATDEELLAYGQQSVATAHRLLTQDRFIENYLAII